MNYPLVAGFFDLPRFLAFGITGMAVGLGTTFRRRAEAALRRSELELRKARNELEMKVAERTSLIKAQRSSLGGSAEIKSDWQFRVERFYGRTFSGPKKHFELPDMS